MAENISRLDFFAGCALIGLMIHHDYENNRENFLNQQLFEDCVWLLAHEAETIGTVMATVISTKEDSNG